MQPPATTHAGPSAEQRHTDEDHTEVAGSGEPTTSEPQIHAGVVPGNGPDHGDNPIEMRPATTRAGPSTEQHHTDKDQTDENHTDEDHTDVAGPDEPTTSGVVPGVSSDNPNEMRVVDLATPDTSSTITYQAGQEFQPGTRRVVAQGILCGHHRNVAFLSISPGRLDRLLSFLRFLPAPLRAIVQSRWPEWFLPPKIVLKRQKLGWDEEFDNEKSIYQRLAPLQGTVVPVFYGEASCPATEDTGTRALVFSHVDGIGLYEEAAGGMEREEVRSMLMASLLAMSSLGVIHDDYKLDNFVLVGD